MSNQNTYPDYFSDPNQEANTNDRKTTENKKSNFQKILDYKNNLDHNQHIKDNKNKIALAISCISSLLLLISGMQIILLNFWFVIVFYFALALFVTSSIFTYLFKTSRNVIWIQLLGILLPYLIFAVFSNSAFTGSVWLALILIIFLLFIAFLETENAVALNRIFIFKNVIHQPKKLLILSACVITTFGCFMGINSLGGPSYIESVVNDPIIYKNLFDPSAKTAILGKVIISEKTLKEIDGSTNVEKKPLTYQDFLMLKVEDSTKEKLSFYQTFAEKTYCNESANQGTDEVCKQKLADYSRLVLTNKSKIDYGVDIIEGSQIQLESKMTKENIKAIIKKSYAHNLSSFINSSSSATNPLKIFSLLGKSEGIALFISTLVFLVLLATFAILNIVVTIFSSLVYQYLKVAKIVKIAIIKDEVEILEF